MSLSHVRNLTCVLIRMITYKKFDVRANKNDTV